jgi:hypothetical protein|tara:strand:- start:2422 stop:2643 length:222 start_codon:yes stop_codon:yes gene_type:complete
MAKKKEANLISFKVVLTANNDIVTELSMLPVEEVDKVFKTRDENEIVKTILQAGQKKFATLHNYFQSELDFIK